MVGCVLVRGREIVGEGHHAHWGGAHAERAALAAAGPLARGATAYVTLEPCAHHGKTPPCADALIDAGVAEVVYACADANPRTAGAGPARLRKAGVRVRKARAPVAARRLLLRYDAARRRPWVIAKWAMTLDGRIASRSGDSKWITGEEARAWAHRELRGHVDAILVGAGTARADDPALTNRSGEGAAPLRVVVCGRRPLRRRARLLSDGGPTLLAAPEGFRAPRGCEVETCGKEGRVDLRRLLRRLHARGLGRILVEGGSALHGELFDRDLVDQVAVFIGCGVVGGMAATAPVGGRGRARVSQAHELNEIRVLPLGFDQLIEGYTR